MGAKWRAEEEGEGTPSRERNDGVSGGNPVHLLLALLSSLLLSPTQSVSTSPL